MAKSLGGLSEKARRQLQEPMPPGAPYPFTHGDLTHVNIMVENGNLTGIIDWEVNGYFPAWWEFVCTSIGYDEENKGMERPVAEAHVRRSTEAREFWRDYYALSRYSNSSLNESMKERAKKLFDELLGKSTARERPSRCGGPLRIFWMSWPV